MLFAVETQVVSLTNDAQSAWVNWVGGLLCNQPLAACGGLDRQIKAEATYPMSLDFGIHSLPLPPLQQTILSGFLHHPMFCPSRLEYTFLLVAVRWRRIHRITVVVFLEKSMGYGHSNPVGYSIRLHLWILGVLPCRAWM